MKTLYTIAKGIWRAAKWIWTAIVVAILVSVASTLLGTDVKNVVGTTASKILAWLTSGNPGARITLILLLCFILISAAAALIVAVLKKDYEGKAPQDAMLTYYQQRSEADQKEEKDQQALVEKAYQHYLRTVEETLKTIRLLDLPTSYTPWSLRRFRSRLCLSLLVSFLMRQSTMRLESRCGNYR